MRRWIEINARQGIGSELKMIAGPYARLGQPLKATRLLAAGHMILNEIGAGDHPSDIPQLKLYTAYIKEVIGVEAFANAWAEGSRMTVSEAIAYALAT
jgi:hypothetical protein